MISDTMEHASHRIIGGSVMSGIQTTLSPPTHEWLPAGFEIRQEHVNGIALSAAVGGTGPTLVLLHGWPQTNRAWRDVMPQLAETHTVVAPDLRGAGASEIATGGYAKTNQAEDMRQLLQRLGLESPTVVVGHDIGAMVALAWAAKFPDDVAALVLLDVTLPGLGLEDLMDVARGGMWHFGFFGAPWPIPEMLFDGHELEFFTASFHGISNPGTFTDDDLAYYAEAYSGRERLRGGFEQYRTLLDDGRETRELLAGGRLPMPVLAVGGGDRMGASVGEELRDHAVDLTTDIAPTGHFIAEEAPDWFVKTLRAFLDRA